LRTIGALDRRQLEIDEINRKKILDAVYEIESKDLTRPYANITEISLTSGLSRATVRKHLKILEMRNMVLKVAGKGRASWYSSYYAIQAKGVYEDLLRRDQELNSIVDTPVKKLKLSSSILTECEGIKSARKKRPISLEELTLILQGRGTDFETSLLSNLKWLNRIRIDYFSKTGRMRKVLEGVTGYATFLYSSSRLEEDLEMLEKTWLILSWHPVCLRIFPELKNGILAIQTVLHELVALREIIMFHQRWTREEHSRFRRRVLKGLNRCEKELASFLDMENVRSRLDPSNGLQDKNSIYNSGG
jgi:DNA-binding transcriptional ArsR family regulator